jgi:hypothetical protein
MSENWQTRVHNMPTTAFGGIYGEDKSGAYILGVHLAARGRMQCAWVATGTTLVEVCQHPNAIHVENQDDYEIYGLAVRPDAVWMRWSRGPSGGEEATVLRGYQRLTVPVSFVEAQEIALHLSTKKEG